MFSSLFMHDTPNSAFGYAKGLGYLCLENAADIEIPDSINVSLGEFPFEGSEQTDVVSVNVVVHSANPFEISHGIISFDAVNVVDLWEIEWIWNECGSHQSVDVMAGSFSADHEADVGIVSSRHTPTEYTASPLHGSSIFVNGSSINAAHVTNVANLVKSFESENSSPFFINHLMGPFARSAHSIVLSSTTQGGHQCRFH